MTSKAIQNAKNTRKSTFNNAQAIHPNLSRSAIQSQQGFEKTTNANQANFKQSSVYASHIAQGPGSYEGKQHSFSYKPKENNGFNNYTNANTQHTKAPSSESSNIQYGSVNWNSDNFTSQTQPVNIPEKGRSQCDNFPANNVTMHHAQSKFPPKKYMPRSVRTNNDTNVYTQSYTHSNDYSQRESSNNNSNRHFNHRPNANNKNSYGRPSAINQQTGHNNDNDADSYSDAAASYQKYSQQLQEQYRRDHPHSQQPQNTYHHSTSPNRGVSSSRDTNTLSSTPTTTAWNQSPPNIPTESSLNSSSDVPAASTWNSPPVFYSSFVPNSNSTYNKPPAVKKTLKIVDPITGEPINTPNQPIRTQSKPISPATENPVKFDFKIPERNVSKRIQIVDPAILEREKQKQQQEEEAKRKAEKERLENERRVAEEKERLEREEKERVEKERIEKERLEREESERKEQERIEKERLEREEKERVERERIEKERLEREEKERVERERIEKERLEREESERKEQERIEKERLEREEKERVERERIEKERLEREEREEIERVKKEYLEAEVTNKKIKEAQQMSEEEQELRRIKRELEAKKKKDEEDRMNGLTKDSESIIPTSCAFQHIEDFSAHKYPEDVVPPAKVNGRITYDVNFLKMFGDLCQHTSANLTVLNETFGSSSTYRAMTANMPRDRSFGNESAYKSGSRDNRAEVGKFNTGRPINPRNSNNFYAERSSSGRGRHNMSGGGMKVFRNPPQQASFGPDPVPQLAKTENRWVPTTMKGKPSEPGEDTLLSEEVIVRKVKALLNKLTVEKFNSISGQIFDYCRQSEKEMDGKALRTVMRLTFEKACDEPAFASMWASLCQSMQESMTDAIVDNTVFDKNNEPCHGVLLFRRYLFNRCQEEFEKGWKTNMPDIGEGEMLTDEYYVAAKAKRQGLGLIQFIGELFKLGMLSEQIMYGCLIKLSNDPTNAGDEEAESLCKLLTTVGKALDSKQNTCKWVNIVSMRMEEEMLISSKLTSRVKFMIKDLLDLRKNKWVPRNGSNQVGPTTLAKIHEMAEKDKEQKEAMVSKKGGSNRGPYVHNSYNNTNAQRTSSFRRDNFQTNAGGSSHADGWNTINTNTSSQTSDKSRSSELYNFGKIDRSNSRNTILGPSSSPFTNLTRNKSNNESRSNPTTNTFSALSSGEKPEDHKKFKMKPKPYPTENLYEPIVINVPPGGFDDDVVERKSQTIIEEYYSIFDKKEFVECLKELNEPHYHEIFVKEMLKVVEKKDKDVEIMCELIRLIESEKLISKEIFIQEFKEFMKGYDDLVIDVPQVSKHVAKLLDASPFTSSDDGTEDIFCHQP